MEEAQALSTQQARLAAARSALASVQQRMGTTREAWEAPSLPLAQGLDQLVPQGLRRGQVLAVEGSTSLLLAVAAKASAEGAWAAIVGMPHVGVVAAARRGMDLARVALIPHPGTQAPAVLGACVDGMDMVIAGRGLAISDADRRSLAARARERGAVVLAEGVWQGANVTLTVERSRWSGLGAGEGRLREREITVAVSGRSVGATRRVLLRLEVDAQALRLRPGARNELADDRAAGAGAGAA